MVMAMGTSMVMAMKFPIFGEVMLKTVTLSFHKFKTKPGLRNVLLDIVRNDSRDEGQEDVREPHKEVCKLTAIVQCRLSDAKLEQ